MNQDQLGDRLKMLQAARRFARDSEADTRCCTNLPGHRLDDQLMAHRICVDALRIIRAEIKETHEAFLDAMAAECFFDKPF